MRYRIIAAVFVALWIGLECGYRIGINAEAHSHQRYIELVVNH